MGFCPKRNVVLLQLLQHSKLIIYNACEGNFKDCTNHLNIAFSPGVCTVDVLHILDMLHIYLLDKNVHTHILITLGKTSMLSLRNERFSNLTLRLLMSYIYIWSTYS